MIVKLNYISEQNLNTVHSFGDADSSVLSSLIQQVIILSEGCFVCKILICRVTNNVGRFQTNVMESRSRDKLA